jgi:hypothetical protein
MVTGFEKSAQNGIALTGMFQPDPLEVVVENVFRLADHFIRNVG